MGGGQCGSSNCSVYGILVSLVVLYDLAIMEVDILVYGETHGDTAKTQDFCLLITSDG